MGCKIKDVVNVLPAFELKFKEPFNGLGISLLNVPMFSLFGEYVVNLNDSKPDDEKTGFMIGCKFGADKISGWGDWQAKYNFARLGKDAVLDELPDSDRYGGRTDIGSHELVLEYGLGKSTSLALDIYRSYRLVAAEAPETLVQLDWNMKF